MKALVSLLLLKFLKTLGVFNACAHTGGCTYEWKPVVDFGCVPYRITQFL